MPIYTAFCSVHGCDKLSVWKHVKRVGDIEITSNSCEDHFNTVKDDLDKIKSPKVEEGFNDAHVAA